MDSRQTALIIGAGLGGVVTAAQLARKGYRVTVLEKNGIPGGRCSQLVRDGHRFDTGPTLFLIPEVFAEAYTSLGERMEDHLDLRRIDPTYQFHFDDGSQLAITADLKAMQSQLEAIEPGSFDGLLRYMVEGHKHYCLAVQRLAGRGFYSLLEYLSPQNLQLFFKLKALIKHYDNMGNFFKHPYLKAAFTFQDMYLGLSPFDAPAIYSLLQYTELVDGVWFPMGGMYAVVESFVSIAEAQGAQFMYNKPVKQIVVENNQASGVILQDGSRFRADVIIANADLPYVYRNLLPDKARADRLERLKYTCSAIMFYWGVDRVYPELDTHNLFVAGDYRASLDRVFKDKSLPDEPNFYVHAPVRTDPTAAPPGQDTLMVLVPVGRLDENNMQDWQALQSMARSAVLRRLDVLGLTDLEEHLKFEASYTPRSWQGMYNIAKGAAFGSVSHNFRQVGYLRPQNRHPHYRNLYFAGASTHPGSGLPLVLLSARLTTERILNEVGVPQMPRSFAFNPERVATQNYDRERGETFAMHD
jgi:phytoene desaturase